MVVLPVVKVAAFCMAIVFTIGMWMFLLHSRLGRSIRASAQNLTAARLYGVEPRRLYATTFAIGTALTVEDRAGSGVFGGCLGEAYVV